MLNCGLGVILGRERCPHDLEGSSSGYLLPAATSPPPLLHFLCCPPSPPPLPPGAGRGGLSFLLAQRAAPPTGHPGGDGRGRSWRPALGAAWRGPRRPGGRACRWLRRPGGSQTCLTTGRQGPASSGPATESPAWTMTFWTLWVETAAWTVERGTPPSQGHLGPLLSPAGL